LYLGFRVHHPDIWSTFLQTDCCSAICTEVTAICILTLNMGGLGLCPRTRTLLDARAHVGYKDHGARLHVVSQLIQETVESGRPCLPTACQTKKVTGKKAPPHQCTNFCNRRDWLLQYELLSLIPFLLLFESLHLPPLLLIMFP